MEKKQSSLGALFCIQYVCVCCQNTVTPLKIKPLTSYFVFVNICVRQVFRLEFEQVRGLLL